MNVREVRLKNSNNQGEGVSGLGRESWVMMGSSVWSCKLIAKIDWKMRLLELRLSRISDIEILG